MKRPQEFAARRRVEPFVAQVFTGSGDEAVVFHNGSRILFGARERGFGRGIPGVDVFVYDEGQILSEKAMQNTLATLNTSWLGLHIYAGTPPRSEDLSKAQRWMTKHDEVWENKDPEVVRIRVAHPHVAVDARVLNGSPHVRGSRVPVRRLWIWHRGGATVDTLIKRYPQLGAGAILDALSFAYDNQDLIEADAAREQAALEKHPPVPIGIRPLAQLGLFGGERSS